MVHVTVSDKYNNIDPTGLEETAHEKKNIALVTLADRNW